VTGDTASCGCAKEMSRSLLEGIQDLTEHHPEDARRDNRQHRIVELVVYRKVNPSMILIERLEAPDSPEVAEGSIESVDADATSHDVACGPVGVAHLSIRSASFAQHEGSMITGVVCR
jgi:hypothetical protein